MRKSGQRIVFCYTSLFLFRCNLFCMVCRTVNLVLYVDVLRDKSFNILPRDGIEVQGRTALFHSGAISSEVFTSNKTFNQTKIAQNK